MHLTEALVCYQEFIRQSLAHFAEKAKLPSLLKQAIASDDTAAETELRSRIRRGEAVEIRTFREAKELIELDIHISNILEVQPPPRSSDEISLSEEEVIKVDNIMEHIRKKAMESRGAKT